MPRLTRKKNKKISPKQSLLIKGVPGYGEKSPVNGSNLYTPGTHILIKKPLDKELNKFNLIILLAWNFKREILNYLKKIKFIGDIIIPLPKIKLVKFKK